MKRTLSLVLVLLFAGSVAAHSLPRQKKKEAAKPPSQKPPSERPKVTEVDEAGLKSLLAESAAKGRPLLVNFWATWCTPCRDEFPDLVKIRERFPAGSLDFVTVSLDDPSEIAAGVPDFLAEMRAGTIPAYLLNAQDEDAAVAAVDPAWRKELPATFLYDRAGALSFKHTGRIKPAELVAAIEQARGAK